MATAMKKEAADEMMVVMVILMLVCYPFPASSKYPADLLSFAHNGSKSSMMRDDSLPGT